MTTLREAAQQALEALCCVRDMVAHPDNLEFIDKHITALRERLAEPVQEPVAWYHVPYPNNGISPMVSLSKHHEPSMYGAVVPLYIAPPQRKPLSEEELSKIIDAEIGFNSCVGWEEGFARAIERAVWEKNNV